MGKTMRSKSKMKFKIKSQKQQFSINKIVFIQLKKKVRYFSILFSLSKTKN